METLLRYFLIIAALLSLGGLIRLLLQAFSFGRRTLHSAPQGDWKKGVLYAFGQGMMPWEKESAKKHLVTYTAGFLYHFGIFAAFAYLWLTVIKLSPSRPVLLVLQLFMGSGLVCGMGMLLKRIFREYMRRISCWDDYIANILVDLFLLLALLDSLTANMRLVLYTEAIVMILYIPLGKIRHCFFFFYSRILFGYFFGRRGVFPRSQGRFRV